MANEQTSTVLASVINAEMIMEARMAFQVNANLPRLVRVADLTGQPTNTASWPVYAAGTVTKPGSEEVSVTTNSTPAPTDVTAAVARRTIIVSPTDLGVSGSVDNLSATFGKLIGEARAKQVDTDILAVMTTNYTSSVGATNSTDVTIANILSALLTLEGNEANQNLVLALHPKQWNHIRGDLVLSAQVTANALPTDNSVQGQQVLTSGVLFAPIFGAQVLVTPRVGTGADTNDMYLGVLGNFAEAIGYAVKNVNRMLGIPEIELDRTPRSAMGALVHNYYDKAAIIRAAGLVLVKSQTY